MKGLQIILSFVALLGAVQIFVSNRLVSSDTKLSAIVATINRLEQENEDLRQKISSFSALSTISSFAEQAGFHQKTQYLYIQSHFPLALDQRK